MPSSSCATASARPGVGHEGPVGVGGDAEGGRYRDAGRDQLAEVGSLAADQREVAGVHLIERADGVGHGCSPRSVRAAPLPGADPVSTIYGTVNKTRRASARPTSPGIAHRRGQAMRDADADGGSPVAGVLFDMGGTVFGYESRARSWERRTRPRCAGSVSIPTTTRCARPGASPPTRSSRAYAARPSFLHRDLFRDRIRRTGRTAGSRGRRRRPRPFRRRERRGHPRAHAPEADATAALRALGERGIYRAIVSNADDTWVEPALARHGLLDLFEDWTSSEEAGSLQTRRRHFRARPGQGRSRSLRRAVRGRLDRRTTSWVPTQPACGPCSSPTMTGPPR